MKKILSQIICLTAVFFICGAAFTSERGEGFRIIERTGTFTILEWNAPELDWQTVSVQNREYVIPRMGDLPCLHNDGEPQLPTDGLLFEVDSSANPTVTILDSVTVVSVVKSICPAPSWRYDTAKEISSPVYEPAHHIYSEPTFYPVSSVNLEQSVYRGHSLLRVGLYPIRYNPSTNSASILQYIRIKVNHARPADLSPRALLTLPAKKGGWEYVSKSIPGSSLWYDPAQEYLKLYVTTEGIYGLSGFQIQEKGYNIESIDPRSIQLYYLGQKQPCQVTGEADGRFDPSDRILFSVFSPESQSVSRSAYNDTLVYWLSWGGQPGSRFQSRPALTLRDGLITSLKTTHHIEEDILYHAGDSDVDIQESDQVAGEGWIWHFVNVGETKRVSFDLPGLDTSSDSVRMRLRIKGTTLAPQAPDHHVRVSINKTVVIDYRFNDREDVVLSAEMSRDILQPVDNQLEIISLDDLNADRSQFYFDWMEFDYRKVLTATSGWLSFSTDRTVPSHLFVNGFQTDSVQILDLVNGDLLIPEKVSEAHQDLITVESGGIYDGNRAIFRMNGQQVFSGARGHNVVTLDPVSGSILRSQNFDTWGSVAQVDSLVAFIDRLPTGTILLAAIRDEGASHLTEAAYLAYESVGSALIRQVKNRESWAIIGRKGAEIGSVPERRTENYSGPAVVDEELFFSSGGPSFSVAFSDSLTSGVLAVFEERGIKQVSRISKDEPSNLRSTDNSADYIIITHSLFQDQAKRLAVYRANNSGLRVKVVMIEDVYDEFNYGLVDPVAIKEFVDFAYHSWQGEAPGYLLLLGDASWDPKFHLDTATKADLVPSYGNPVSDTWYVCLDGPNDIVPELHIGRIPVESPEEADAVISKIVEYDRTPSAAWKKKFVFINGGFNLAEQAEFFRQARFLADTYVTPAPTAGSITYINKDTQGLYEGEHHKHIIKALDEGSVWTNFLGHGASHTWDLMFHNADIEVLDNSPRYSFITSMTCHTGRFAEPNQTSFGELFLKVPEKGAIAFLGTSGWGYSYEDYLFLQQMCPVVLADTVHRLGDAVTLSKLYMWEKFGSGAHIRNMNLQYILLGDPAVDLAVAEWPDLVINPADLSISPLVPSEADSTARISVKINNFGLTSVDSVEIILTANHPQKGRIDIGGIKKIPPVYSADSLDYVWDLKGMTGTVKLEAVADPNDYIAEVNENNNRQEYQVTVLSSMLQLSSPQQNAMIPDRNAVLKILTPQETADEAFSTEFQLDTLPDFASSFLQRSGSVRAEKLISRWKPSSILPNQLHFWRSKEYSEASQNAWINGSFYVSSDSRFGWWQGNKFLFAKNNRSRVDTTGHSVSLKKSPVMLYVESAGLQDGSYARLIVNAKAAIEEARGMNIVVIDGLSGAIESAENFDTYGDTTAARRLVDYLDLVAGGDIVMCAIKDEASRLLSDDARAAFESIGSAKCRQIGYRDSWAIIGRKGADIGTVPEVLSKSGTGQVVVVDTLDFYNMSGQMISPKIGPTAHWRFLSWQADQPDFTSCDLIVVGYNRLTGQADTLFSDLTPGRDVDLSDTDARKYRYLTVIAELKTLNARFSPLLKEWSLVFDPVADLAIGPRVFTQSSDSVLIGESLSLKFDVYNIGQAPADSLRIQFQESDPVLGRKTFASQALHAVVPVDSFVRVEQEWSSAGKTGKQQLFITVDPFDSVPELNEYNNTFATAVYVRSDTVKPEIRVTFDGEEIFNGDLISSRPEIVATIRDNSPQPISDTSSVNILLDGQRLSLAKNDQTIKIQSVTSESNKGVIEYKPVLEDGEHSLDFFITDPSDNLADFHINFRVESELSLQKVMNYPNPFSSDTHFTFELTQPADVRIKVYTVAGRLIRNIETGWMNAGFHSIYWDGRDEDGDDLANGTYIYKIDASNESEKAEEISKIVVMR